MPSSSRRPARLQPIGSRRSSVGLCSPDRSRRSRAFPIDSVGMRIAGYLSARACCLWCRWRRMTVPKERHTWTIWQQRRASRRPSPQRHAGWSGAQGRGSRVSMTLVGTGWATQQGGGMARSAGSGLNRPRRGVGPLAPARAGRRSGAVVGWSGRGWLSLLLGCVAVPCVLSVASMSSGAAGVSTVPSSVPHAATCSPKMPDATRGVAGVAGLDSQSRARSARRVVLPRRRTARAGGQDRCDPRR